MVVGSGLELAHIMIQHPERLRLWVEVLTKEMAKSVSIFEVRLGLQSVSRRYSLWKIPDFSLWILPTSCKSLCNNPTSRSASNMVKLF